MKKLLIIFGLLNLCWSSNVQCQISGLISVSSIEIYAVPRPVNTGFSIFDLIDFVKNGVQNGSEFSEMVVVTSPELINEIQESIEFIQSHRQKKKAPLFTFATLLVVLKSGESRVQYLAVELLGGKKIVEIDQKIYRVCGNHLAPIIARLTHQNIVEQLEGWMRNSNCCN